MKMKKRNLLMLIGSIISTLILGITSAFAESTLIPNIKSTVADKYEPTGDANIGYPQIAIRTNHTAERTNQEAIIQKANEVADQYPIEDKEHRAKAVTEALTKAFGGGSLGHTWIVFFNSDKKGDYTSYGYHNGYGFVKNGVASDRNDSAERKFNLERILPVKDINFYPDQLEKTIIPKLNKQSAEIAKLAGIPISIPDNGAYTPINNCSWFAGNLWNYATKDNLVFEQNFDGASHADYWGDTLLKSNQ
ncbi:hypothetical protein ACT7C7_30525 [Bacillus cereus]